MENTTQKRTVQLRNKNGQFCNLQEFCDDEPIVEVVEITSFENVHNRLAEVRMGLIVLKQFVEIAQVFELPVVRSSTCANIIRLKFLKRGAVSITTAGYLELSKMILTVEEWLKHGEELAGKWSAMGYTVEG